MVVDEVRNGVVIEPASWLDLNAVRQLEQVCFPKDAWPLWDLIGILSFPNVVRLKAVVGRRLVGFIGADIREKESTAWIATIGVLPEYQGRGIGGRLLEGCERRLDVIEQDGQKPGEGRGGIQRIRLSVRVSNAEAIRLYERAGYEQVGIWRGYYNDGEDGLVMEKIRE